MNATQRQVPINFHLGPDKERVPLVERLRRFLMFFRLSLIDSLAVKLSKRLLLLAALAFCLGCPRAAHAGDETDIYDNGIGLMGRKKYAEAEAEFRKSIKADPRYKEAWEALTDALRAEGKPDQAETS
jgi:tetratricopeptide (TPR) repeat protein